jgi:transposase-like protein
MRKEGLSYAEAMRQYEIGDDHIIKRWERIYLEEGSEGLYIEHRGRASTANGTQKGRKPKLGKQVEEDLIAEVQRLRAENACLKNLQALVLEDERRQHKKRW